VFPWEEERPLSTLRAKKQVPGSQAFTGTYEVETFFTFGAPIWQPTEFVLWERET